MHLFLRDDHQEEFIDICVFDDDDVVDLYVEIDNSKFIRLMQERPNDIDKIYILKEDLLALRRFILGIYLFKIEESGYTVNRISDDIFKVVNNHACELGLFILRD